MGKLNLRHERKYFLTNIFYHQIERLVKINPASFSKPYQDRIINNVYFDTPGFDYYYENVEGVSVREKARIRWYGDGEKGLSKPVLEYKNKIGLLGHKISFKLQPMTLSDSFSRKALQANLLASGVPRNFVDHFSCLRPCLMNSYHRSYFLSKNQRARVTIDSNLSFRRFIGNGKLFTQATAKRPDAFVVEVKYAQDADELVKDMFAEFPFSVTKSSKYVQGMQAVFM